MRYQPTPGFALLLGAAITSASCSGTIDGGMGGGSEAATPPGTVSGAGAPGGGGSAMTTGAEGTTGPNGSSTTPGTSNAAPAPAPLIPAIDDVLAAPCNPDARGTTELGLRRLTKKEVVTSLYVLFGGGIDIGYQAQYDMAQALSLIPDQTPVTSAQFDNTIADVEGLELVAELLATNLVNNTYWLNRVLPGCNVGNVAKCIDVITNQWAQRAFRRPPPRATQQSIRNLITSIGGADGIKSGLVRVVTSPYFHQHVEVGEDAVDCVTDCPPIVAGAARLRLSPYEIAARLSYQLTTAPPDDMLLSAAAAGQLRTLDALKTHAVRLLSNPRVYGPDLPPAKLGPDAWRNIVTGWLGLRQVADPDSVVASALGVPSATGLGAEAQEELLRFATSETFDKKAPLSGLFTDKVAFPYTDRLATAFGTTRSDAAQPVANGLGGLILRPGTLLSGTKVSSPILRGVFIRKRIMCDQIPDPDAMAVDARLEATKTITHKDFSNRDYFTMLTSPAACNGCHGLINPVGYTLEGFGPIGAPRTVEGVYDEKGPLTVTHPINTVVTDLKLDASRVVPSRGAADTVDYIARSPRAAACFDANLIVNTHYRPLDRTDRCLMDELAKVNAGSQPAFDALVQSVANDGIFWKSTRGLQ